MSANNKQTTNSVIMVRPTDFEYNCETGLDNEFQRRMALSPNEVKTRALAEFKQAVTNLESHGIKVMILEKQNQDYQTPDAVFPNNWLATDKQGNIHIFPMKTVNRQWEVRPEAAKQLLEQHQFKVNDIYTIYKSKSPNARVLEGTGAIVFDHTHKIAYAALSERCHLPLLEDYCQHIGYKPHCFSTRSSEGNAIYHTNVVMSVGSDFVVCCVEAILRQDREDFVEKVQATGKTLIDINLEQMEQHYCGNILELNNQQNERIVVMSQQAWNGFNPEQQDFFQTRAKICATDITTIETIGGGSMRCMLAEVFNPEQ